MILIIIAIFIGASISLYNEIGGWGFQWSEIIWYLLCLLGGAMAGLAVGFLIALAIPMDTYHKKYSLKIEALQDGSNTVGRFFLGTGHIEGKMKYVFYYEEDGLYTLKQVDSGDAKVKYTDGTPQVDVTEIEITDSWINGIALDMDIHDKTYIIEVPKGTINNSYNLDAQ